MRARLRPVARLLAGSLLFSVAVAAVGVFVAVWRDSDMRETVAMALWISGAIVLLVFGLAGSPSRNVVAGRAVLGGRMVGAPVTYSPLGLAVVGFVLVAAGVLVYVVG